MKVTLKAELTYDEKTTHESTAEGFEWFKGLLMNPQEPLILHSNDIGDEVGIIKVLSVSATEVPRPAGNSADS